MIKVKCRGYEGYLTKLLSDSNTGFALDGTIHGNYDVEIWLNRTEKISISGVQKDEIEFISE